QLQKKSLSNYLYSGLRYEKNPELLGRVSRLSRFLHIQSFDVTKVNFTDDDRISFLIQNYETKSGNPRLLKLQKEFNLRIKKEHGVDISLLMKKHDQEFERIENEYD